MCAARMHAAHTRSSRHTGPFMSANASTLQQHLDQRTRPWIRSQVSTQHYTALRALVSGTALVPRKLLHILPLAFVEPTCWCVYPLRCTCARGRWASNAQRLAISIGYVVLNSFGADLLLLRPLCCSRSVRVTTGELTGSREAARVACRSPARYPQSYQVSLHGLMTAMRNRAGVRPAVS